jgi:diguanylate cyclase (GGDEF)-like protein
MLPSIDLLTLRLSSVLASVTFMVIYIALWRGRKDRRHNLHWAASLGLYCMALAGLEWIHRPQDVLIRAMLVATLTASNIPLSTGMRLFAGRPMWRWWMALPPTVTLLGFLLPHIAAKLGVLLPPQTEQVLTAVGLALGMIAFGTDLLRQAPHAVPGGWGGRIAGLAMLGYLPCYLCSIAGEMLHLTTPDTLALVALLSDQLLLMLLNVGLMAMPAEAAMVKMRDHAWRDGLTGARNRAWLAVQHDRLLTPGAWLAHIDIDHFKSINDRFGHLAGDATLVQLAHALNSAAEGADLPSKADVVRMGGDEFLVIMPDATMADAQELILRVKSATRGVSPFPWTMSIGLSQIKTSDRVLEDAIERADQQLYAAKLAGRDRIAA